MTTEAPAPPDRILRECDCPPWVIRCAHLDGESVRLFNWNHESYCPGGECTYHICWGEGHDGGKGLDQDAWCFAPHRYENGLAYTHDEQEAIAAFHEAEEKLLRGDLA